VNKEIFMDLIAGSQVTRWHTRVTLKTQSNAEHQWRVAMIAETIEPSISKQTLLYALTHDCFEHLTGDMPYNVKQNIPALGYQMRFAEEHYSDKMNLPKAFKQEENVVKAADRFCAMLFAIEEFHLGNKKMVEISNRVWEGIDKNEFGLNEKQLDRLKYLSSQVLKHYDGV